MITKLGQSVIAFLLTCIVGMLAWFLPNLSNKVDENQRFERDKLQTIFDIKTSVFKLEENVSSIQTKFDDAKKNNNYIYNSINSKLNIAISDIRELCTQVKRYGDTQNWTNHPDCKINSMYPVEQKEVIDE